MIKNLIVSIALFIGAVVFCFSSFCSPPLALLAGLLFAVVVSHPFRSVNSKITKWLLQISVVGLGFGMNLYEAAEAGKQGFFFTTVTIAGTVLLGLLFGKLFSIHQKTTLLISSGTSICGGSAIAAISPIIEADEGQMSVSLGTVFILNSVALLIFPLIGNWADMSQNQFGLWAAVAIHDTSSVVGAAQKFGSEALHVATTVKLERALWIVPLSAIIAFTMRYNTGRIRVPYFILFFIGAMALNTFVPAISHTAGWIHHAARKAMMLTLFLIGTGLNPSAVRNVGLKSMFLGVILWIIISVSTFFFITGTVN